MNRDKHPVRPIVKKSVRIAIQADNRGVTLYCNPDAIKALSDDLAWIHKADASEHYETHIRLQFGGDEGQNVSVSLSEDLRSIFNSIPDDAPPDAQAFVFELTIMQVTDDEVRQF
ncbi:hypothetical protein K9U39_17790 [Rhodoblastus acidophilus]|uniref:Uncharacterized protein n=1 Tax=Candidatus Rhodoblastus alkanivorans TaxID=2954117 RepID=A0ABS9Z284_9HYPH|nr:hypothetical protein [Candidatus Rhodoblastus alkanivorans]MCI4679028.1 hypothetical protein [Candidatus Rhodoblastus alkanivorans]MCI4681717.1 hypothetical protein [Candidatus Rhodoblastus alkanivorans]MDI4642765.1 hypothetical protein [Rhodoblastus acidophilus]